MVSFKVTYIDRGGFIWREAITFDTQFCDTDFEVWQEALSIAINHTLPGEMINSIELNFA